MNLVDSLSLSLSPLVSSHPVYTTICIATNFVSLVMKVSQFNPATSLRNMWDALQDVARNLSFIVDGGGESPRKCPRCRGSGLLKAASAAKIWEKNEGHANQPCWFCEGIGVLPITGLSGFVLARATPRLGALEKHKQSYKDTSQLHACNDGKEAIKFTNRKLNVAFGDLLFDCKTSWINELTSSLGSQQESSLGIQQDHFGSSKVKISIQNYKWEQTLHPHSSLGMLQPVSRSETSENGWDSVFDPLAINLSHADAALHVTSAITEAAFTFPVNKSAGQSHMGHNLLLGFDRHLSFPQRRFNKLSTVTTKNLGAEASKPIFQIKPCMLSTRRRRPLRRTRNSIRDKARRDAMERARSVMRVLKFHKIEDLDSAEHYQQYGCCDKPSIDLECRGSTLQGLSPLGMVPRTGSLTGQSASLQPLTRTFETLMPPLQYNSSEQNILPVLSSLSCTIRSF